MKKTIDLNLGGTVFTVTTHLLTQYPDTVLGQLLTDKVLKKETYLKSSNSYFFDDDPDMFKYVLEALRTGTVNFPHSHKKEPAMVAKLNSILKRFKVVPERINFNDSCAEIDVDLVKEHCHDTRLDARMDELVTWMLMDELVTKPETFVGSHVKFTGADQFLLTSSFEQVNRIAKLDMSFLADTPLEGTVVSGTDADGVCLQLKINRELLDEHAFVKDDDPTTLTDAICDMADFPHGSKLEKIELLFYPDNCKDWSLEYVRDGTTVVLTSDRFQARRSE